jgi:hypothetical protein
MCVGCASVRCELRREPHPVRMATGTMYSTSCYGKQALYSVCSKVSIILPFERIHMENTLNRTKAFPIWKIYQKFQNFNKNFLDFKDLSRTSRKYPKHLDSKIIKHSGFYLKVSPLEVGNQSAAGGGSSGSPRCLPACLPRRGVRR